MAHLKDYLEEQSFKESRVCHSTGKIIVEEATRVSEAELICRGSRNFQLRILCGVGFLAEPTDEEWNRKFQDLKKGNNENPKDRDDNLRDQSGSAATHQDGDRCSEITTTKKGRSYNG